MTLLFGILVIACIWGLLLRIEKLEERNRKK